MKKCNWSFYTLVIKQSENEIKKIIPLTIASIRIKNLEIKFNKRHVRLV